jgi:hypothetical protein
VINNNGVQPTKAMIVPILTKLSEPSVYSVRMELSQKVVERLILVVQGKPEPAQC